MVRFFEKLLKFLQRYSHIHLEVRYSFFIADIGVVDNQVITGSILKLSIPASLGEKL